MASQNKTRPLERKKKHYHTWFWSWSNSTQRATCTQMNTDCSCTVLDHRKRWTHRFRSIVASRSRITADRRWEGAGGSTLEYDVHACVSISERVQISGRGGRWADKGRRVRALMSRARLPTRSRTRRQSSALSSRRFYPRRRDKNTVVTRKNRRPS